MTLQFSREPDTRAVVWRVIRNGTLIGFAARAHDTRGRWRAILPTYRELIEADGWTQTYRSREGVVLRLTMLVEGIEP